MIAKVGEEATQDRVLDVLLLHEHLQRGLRDVIGSAVAEALPNRRIPEINSSGLRGDSLYRLLYSIFPHVRHGMRIANLRSVSLFPPF